MRNRIDLVLAIVAHRIVRGTDEQTGPQESGREPGFTEDTSAWGEPTQGAPACLWVAEEVGQGLCVEEGLPRGRVGYFCRPG